MPLRRELLGLCLGLLTVAAFATNIKIPSLEIATSIYNNGSELVMFTKAQMDMVVEGGYKFGGRVVFGFDGFLFYPDSAQFMPQLSFKAAGLTVRNLFDAPLSFSYFVGENDYVCYGDDFVRLFGTTYLQSNYQASYEVIIDNTVSPPVTYFYNYKGLHRINGNGIKLEYSSPDEPFGFAWYLYHDHNFAYSFLTPGSPVNFNVLYFDTGYYSSDLRVFLNFQGFKFEGFVGGTINSENAELGMRCGSLFYFGVDDVNFLLVAGLPALNSHTAFDLSLFYILFEARVSLGPVTIIPTVFFRPSWYLQKDNTDLTHVTTSEANRIDFNLNLSIFNPRRDLISFGLEGNLQTKDLLTSPSAQFHLFVLPYITLATPGVYWDIKVAFPLMFSNLFLSLEHIFSHAVGLINIRAEF